MKQKNIHLIHDLYYWITPPAGPVGNWGLPSQKPLLRFYFRLAVTSPEATSNSAWALPEAWPHSPLLTWSTFSLTLVFFEDVLLCVHWCPAPSFLSERCPRLPWMSQWLFGSALPYGALPPWPISCYNSRLPVRGLPPPAGRSLWNIFRIGEWGCRRASPHWVWFPLYLFWQHCFPLFH